jgi:cytochrome c553
LALAGLALLLGALSLLASVSAEDAPEISGEQVYAYCVACHGKRGEGGGDGKYPRIAGLPQPYLDRQLHAFKDQTRINKPMVPIFKHQRFDAEVIELVAAHVAAMTPPSLALWPYEPEPAALTAFPDRAAYKAAGASAYQGACAACHGADAKGDAARGAPPLTGQYPAYLKKQIGDFARGQRKHAASDHCGGITPAQADAVIAHIVELGK